VQAVVEVGLKQPTKQIVVLAVRVVGVSVALERLRVLEQ
jgi:hypothetical protein